MKNSIKNLTSCESQVTDQVQTSVGVGETNINAILDTISTVEADGLNVIEDAQQNDASENVEESSTPECEKLKRDLSEIEQMIPDTLREITSKFTESHEKLMVLYGLVSSVGCLSPMAHVAYADRKNFACLMSLILMPPASGKGVISLVRKLYSKIDSELLGKTKFSLEYYRVALQEYKRSSRAGESVEPPQKPPIQLLCVPGNTTSAMLLSLLADTKGDQSLLQIETEADVLSTVGKSEHFRLLNTLYRQIYHHEVTSQSRRTGYEIVSCENPKLNLVLTGTPSQAAALLRSASDGLVSRFLILFSTPPIEWKDVSPSGDNLDIQFDSLSEKFHSIWNRMRGRKIEMTLSKDQWNEINQFGQQQLPQTSEFLGEDAGSIPKRHANMAVRIALALTIIRINDEQIESDSVQCNDLDFKVALWIMRISYSSAIKLFKSLPGSDKSVKVGSEKHKFYQLLPERFYFKEIQGIIKEMSIVDRTANRYLKSFTESGMLKRLSKGLYEKSI